MCHLYQMKPLVAKASIGNGKIVSYELSGRYEFPATFSSEHQSPTAICSTYQVMGKQAHDTRLVAAMTVHQIPHLLTFNTDDFKRFTEITALDPRSIPV